MVIPGPIPAGVTRIAIIGLRTHAMTISATLSILLSRKAPKASNGSLQNETSALPGTLPNQSESN